MGYSSIFAQLSFLLPFHKEKSRGHFFGKVLFILVQNATKVAKDGSLAYGQAFTHYHIPYGEMTTQPQGMTADRDNFTYTATAMGIQLADPLGRINLIYTKPDGEARDITFGGANFDTLYMICDGQLFMRKMKTKGALPFLPTLKVKKPGL